MDFVINKIVPNIDSNPSKEVKDSITNFMKELVDLCNHHRVWITVHSLGYLKNEVIEGKLLDVAGFTPNDEQRIIVPVYKNRMDGIHER